MSGPDDIDALAVAGRVLANPRTFRLSTHEELAMAGCLVGLNEQLDAVEARPTTNARLAAAVATVLQLNAEWDAAEAACAAAQVSDEGFDQLSDATGDTLCALAEALKALKTIFETEFPNV